MSGRYWGCEMAGPEYDEKRAPNMGSRSMVRHGAQAGTAGIGLMGLLQAVVDMGYLDINQAFLALGILTPIVTTLWKAWDALDVTARIKSALNKKFPIALLLLPLLGVGCAVQIGTMEPKQFTTLGGGTLIACDTRGILLAFGDADLCSNSARGGHVSKTFSAMTLGVVRTVGAAIAGFFGGAGQGMAQAMQADAVEAPAAPAPAPLEFDSGSTPLANPFTAPDPE